MRKYVLRLLATLLTMILIIGMLPVSSSVNAATSGEYGTFVDGYNVLDEMIAKWGTNTHPRIIMSEEKFAELRTHINDGTSTADLLIDLRNEANGFLNAKTLTYNTSGESFLETCRTSQRRITTLALAYNIFGDEAYAERAYFEIETACNFKDWHPYHFLDTAEMCTGLAFGYDWLYNWMNDDQRALVRNNLISKGLNVVMLDYTNSLSSGSRSYYWARVTVGENWQFVCTGGTNLAALAIGDEEGARDISAQVIDYGFKRAYTSTRLAYSAIDGSYAEGLGYWDYATFYLGYQSSALISTTGTDYGLANYEGLRKSVNFVRGMSSNTSTSFSFGDDGASRNTGWFVFLWLGEYYNAPSLIDLRVRNRKNDEYGFRFQDVLWFQEVEQTSSDSFFDSTDWGDVQYSNASFRNTWDTTGMVAALHLGENDYIHHGHYDLGSFYIESNGTRFFTDLGNERNYSLYNRQYSYRIQSEGHNTLVINPSDGIQQRESANCVVTEFRGGNEAYAITDLTDAYVPSGASSVVRGLKMIKDRECVIIQDEISLDRAGDIYWFAHTEATRENISVASDGRSAIITIGSDRLWVGIISDDGEFTVMEASPLETSRQVSGIESTSAYRKLAIHLTNTKDATITVVCIPLRNGQISPSWVPSVLPLSQWSSGSSLDSTSTPTPRPTATNTPRPTATNTPCPTATNTPCPTATNTPCPTATNTPRPTATNTPTVTPTNSPVPTEGIVDPVVAFAERLYTCALARECDIDGRDYWVTVLRNGYSASDVASVFLLGNEITDSNITDEEYIIRLYKTFMGREGADFEVDYWLAVLQEGGTRESIFTGFVDSPEWANLCYIAYINSGSNTVPTVDRTANQLIYDFATRLYTTSLNREGVKVEVEYWSNQLANGKVTGREAAHQFFFSDEFRDSGISDEEYVMRLYRTFMNRDGSIGDITYWVSAIKNGSTREDVFNGFANSNEFIMICTVSGINP